MSLVKSVAIYSERQWSNGLVKRRYQITLTDELGADHISIVGIAISHPEDDGSDYAENVLLTNKEVEIEQYKQTIRDGGNPFLNDSLWNNRVELLISVLNDALSLPAQDALVINGLPYLVLVSDGELIALFGQDQAWVDRVRAKASALLLGKIALDDYQPILGQAA